MKRRWKILIGLAVVVFVIVAVWQISMRLRVYTYKKELLAKGEKLEIAQLTPPPVPDAQNGADIIRKAFPLLIFGDNDWTNLPEPMRIVTPGKAIICFEQPDVRDFYFTNSWSNVMAFMESNRPAAELLKQVMNFPALDFHLNYDSDVEPATNRRALRFCVQILSGEAICNLRKGDESSTATNICTILAIVNGEHDERFHMSDSDREVTASLAARASWELLQSANVNDAELAMLQKSWEKLEYIQAEENKLLMERAMAEDTIRKMRTSRKFFNSQVQDREPWDFSGSWAEDWDTISKNTELSYAKSMWHVWTYPDELQMLHNYQVILETVRGIETNGYFNPTYSNLVNQLSTLDIAQGSSDLQDFQWLFSKESEYVAFDSLPGTLAAEAVRRMVVTAIALKRYQLKHGSYPSSLNALVLEFVSAIPRDPVDGSPLRYRLKPDETFLLYSIGMNGVDNGGDSSEGPHISFSHTEWPDQQALDWVWPQPATPEEIQKFYAQRRN